MLISDVLITPMLMPAPASAPNMPAAMPGLPSMPAPTMETLAKGFRHIGFGYGKEYIVFVLLYAGALYNHVNVHVGVGQRRKNFIGYTRFVRHAACCKFGNIGVVRYAADNKFFLLHCIFPPDNSSRYFVKC